MATTSPARRQGLRRPQTVLDELAPELHYDHAHETFKDRLRALIAANHYRWICDIGGGRTPLFTLNEVKDLGLEYTILDISPEELAHAPAGYRTLSADICRIPAEERRPQFDLVFSKYLAEHVRDGAAMHRNIFAMLRPGGRAFHYFPTMFAPAFVINRLLPLGLSRMLKETFDPSQRGHPKFPALYSWCFGPTRKMRQRFAAIGYEIETYQPFYGTDYFLPIPVLRQLDAALSAWAARRRNPYLTSYAFVILRKPKDAGAPIRLVASQPDRA
jgi:SAM-dependent methyltransferase